MELTHKICTKCGINKTIDNFQKRKTGSTDGYRHQCKQCRKRIIDKVK